VKYLVDADSKLPNLALMRLAAYFRDRRQDVQLVTSARERTLFDRPGEVFGSSIFRFSDKKRAAIERSWGPVRWGGTGISNESSLDEVDPAVPWEDIWLEIAEAVG